MPLFNRGAPTTVLPSGYQPDLDRMPPSGGASCLRTLGLIVLFVGILGGLVVMVVSVVNASRQPSILEATPTPEMEISSETPSPSPTPTLDDWSATGTALVFATASATPTASATADYCAFLTPTSTMTPTLIYTADAWEKTGTAVFFQTQTATLTPLPLPTNPRSWCDNIPPRATMTPLALRNLTDGTATALPTATNTLRPTSLPPIVNQQPDYQPPIQASPLPPIIVPTLAPPVVLPTSTRVRKTKTPTPTATFTSSPTATETMVPVPTTLPLIQIKSADCLQGFPSFAVDNFAGSALNVYWSITRESGEVVNNGLWQNELSIGVTLIADAPAWSGVSGIYTFSLYQPWAVTQPVLTALAMCDIEPSATPIITETAIFTLMSELTAEFTATPTATTTSQVQP